MGGKRRLADRLIPLFPPTPPRMNASGFKVFYEEGFHGLVELDNVLFVLESMAFIVLNYIFNGHAALVKRVHHLVALVLVDAWIVSSLGNEQWSSYPIYVKGG